MKVITTIPPYAPFIKRIAKHPVISGVRLNTVMPTKEPLDVVLKRIKKDIGTKELWIDLKCRQIRTSYGAFFKAPERKKTYLDAEGEEVILDESSPRAHGELRTPPWATLKIDRKIKLDFSKGPIKCWFQDGTDSAYLVDVIDGDTLIMLDGPKRVVGGGESINIIHESLEIEGFFTDLDLQYIEAAKKSGVNTYMLSFVEKDSDIEELIKLDPNANIVAKIESENGVEWAKTNYPLIKEKYKGNQIHLMSARGDLYSEVAMHRPDRIIGALKKVIRADGNAIVASRIMGSLKNSPRPTCSDITDVAFLLEIGYETFMMGDEICFKEDGLMLALDIMKAIGSNYEIPEKTTVKTIMKKAFDKFR